MAKPTGGGFTGTFTTNRPARVPTTAPTHYHPSDLNGQSSASPDGMYSSRPLHTRPTSSRDCVITGTSSSNLPSPVYVPATSSEYCRMNITAATAKRSNTASAADHNATRQNSHFHQPSRSFAVLHNNIMPQATRTTGNMSAGGSGGANTFPQQQPSNNSSSSTDFSLLNNNQQHETPLSMRLSMPFRTAFSRHTNNTGRFGLGRDLFSEDFMDNVFQQRDPFGFTTSSHSASRGSPFSSSFSGDQDLNDDLFAGFDDFHESSPPRQPPALYRSYSQTTNQPTGSMLNSRSNNNHFSSSSSSSSQDSNGHHNSGELADTIHHIIHTEEPDQLEQRVKIFIAQDRARGLEPAGSLGAGGSSGSLRQQFPRISARLPHGGSLSFSFSTTGGNTTMRIEDGHGQEVPPHPMLSLDQKKQLKERLLAQKNDFISGPNTSAMILSSEGNDQESGGKAGVGHQANVGSVAERVMWFEGFPQLQITHQPAGRMHRSAAHIALQNWRNANADFMDFPQLPPFAASHHATYTRSNSNSVEREIPIIREDDLGKSPPPNTNAISITLEVPAGKQTTTTRNGSATGSDIFTPSKPGNHNTVPAPKTPLITDPLQKAAVFNAAQTPTARGVEVKPAERIVPTILPSPEPKPVEKSWLKSDSKSEALKEQEIKPTLVRQIGAKEAEKDPTAKSAEVRKASQNIMKALQNGMRKEEKKEEPKPAVTPTPAPVEKIISKRASPPKTVSSPRSPPVASVTNKENIPQFHYPRGKPVKTDSDYILMEKVRKSFNGKAELKLDEMKDLMTSLGLPLYWRRPVFLAAVGSGAAPRDTITFEMLWNTWKRITANCYDDASRFICLLAKPGCNFLLPDDCTPLIQDVVDTHPGLNILKEAPEFHARYINTVIARMFFCINRSWTGRITIEELRRSNFLQVLGTLEHEDDINVITDFFSYEHFYVIYCKFWELDRDHDLLIDKADLARHNDHAISSKMIDRILSGAVTRGQHQKNGKMSYSEFVWFLIAEEDKRHPRSVEYWFRCMDLDGDGVLSLYELEYFYEEQLQRMKSLGIEALPFEDIACQMLDMVHPKHKDRILLTDLKRCRMTPLFYDSFFNIEKYLLHEHRDPFASSKVDSEDNEPISDWERYAAEEYEMLVSEDTASEDL